jgi:hypothetical protein
VTANAEGFYFFNCILNESVMILNSIDNNATYRKTKMDDYSTGIVTGGVPAEFEF